MFTPRARVAMSDVWHGVFGILAGLGVCHIVWLVWMLWRDRNL